MANLVEKPYHKTLIPHIDILDAGYSYLGPIEWATKDGRLHVKLVLASHVRTYAPDAEWVVSLDGQRIGCAGEFETRVVYDIFARYINGETAGEESFPAPESTEPAWRLGFTMWGGLQRVYYDEVPLGELAKALADPNLAPYSSSAGFARP